MLQLPPSECINIILYQIGSPEKAGKPYICLAYSKGHPSSGSPLYMHYSWWWSLRLFKQLSLMNNTWQTGSKKGHQSKVIASSVSNRDRDRLQYAMFDLLCMSRLLSQRLAPHLANQSKVRTRGSKDELWLKSPRALVTTETVTNALGSPNQHHFCLCNGWQSNLIWKPDERFVRLRCISDVLHAEHFFFMSTHTFRFYNSEISSTPQVPSKQVLLTVKRVLA